jgi:hypothetical protein
MRMGSNVNAPILTLPIHLGVEITVIEYDCIRSRQNETILSAEVTQERDSHTRLT